MTGSGQAAGGPGAGRGAGVGRGASAARGSGAAGGAGAAGGSGALGGGGLLDAVDFGKGPVPVIAQHHLTGDVLMIAYADRDALERTLESGLLTFRSRSRGTLWTKGESSGNLMRVVSLHADCDGDAILARVRPAGPACHTGARSCFDGATGSDAPVPLPRPTLPALAQRLDARRDAPPAASYTARLLADRNLRLKKLGEEAAELAVACADEDAARVAEETADLLYHALVAALAAGVRLEAVLDVLAERAAGPASG